jgi:exosome complex component RRP42
LVLSADGSALDALSIAIKAALADCKIPKVTAVAGPNGGDPTELELDDDPEQCSRLDVSNVPLTVTVSRIGDAHVVDATADESAVADFAVAFAVDARGETRGMTTTMSTNTSHNKGADLSSLRVMRKIARDVCGGLHRATDAFLIAAASRTMEDDEEDGDDEDVHGEDV